MLQRYLISNVVSTVVLYGAVWAYVPSLSTLTKTLTATADMYVMGHTFFGPVLNRIVTVSAEFIGVFGI
jgi:hypothetical protein